MSRACFAVVSRYPRYRVTHVTKTLIVPLQTSGPMSRRNGSPSGPADLPKVEGPSEMVFFLSPELIL
jgi:hypothetical protein